jgi:prepilin-type processing-associated H-X9-DG protein
LNLPRLQGRINPVPVMAAVTKTRKRRLDADNNGLLFLNSRVRFEDLVDGSSYTLAVGEKIIRGYQDLGWMSGTAATLRNTGTPINNDLAGGKASGPGLWNELPAWAGVTNSGGKAPAEWTSEDVDVKEGDYYTAADDNNRPAVPQTPQKVNQAAPSSAGASHSADRDSAGAMETEKGARDGEPSSDPQPDQTNAKTVAGTNGSKATQGADLPERAASANQGPDPLNPFIKRGGNPKAPLRVGGFGSAHPGGANFAFADGSIRFLSEATNKATFQQLGNHRDGKVVEEDF